MLLIHDFPVCARFWISASLLGGLLLPVAGRAQGNIEPGPEIVVDPPPDATAAPDSKRLDVGVAWGAQIVPCGRTRSRDTGPWFAKCAGWSATG